MRTRIGNILIWVIIAATVAACAKVGPDGPVVPPDPVDPVGPAEEKPQPGEYLLPVIETTDIHGYIIKAEDATIHYRMAYLADKVNDIRGHGGGNDKSRLLLLDGGDLYQGAAISNLQDGKPLFTAIDKMGYDAVALGNHEFDWGFENTSDPDATVPDYEWDGRLCVNEVPLICANIYRYGSRVSDTRDYVIVEKTAKSSKGAAVTVKIGVVGFAVDYSGSIMSSKFKDIGYTIQEDYSAANRIAAELEAEGKCDATVLLIHGAADRAAENLGRGSAFDLVLGGHSHVTFAARTAWGMPYLQGGRYCEHYAYADLKFTVDQTGEVSFAGVENISTRSVDSDRDRREYTGQNADNLEEEILEVSDRAIEVSAPQLNEVIGYIDVGATTYYINGSGERAAVMSNWMCDILRRIGNADVAFVNAGGIRTYIALNGKKTRNITVANVYEMFPFGNNTYVYEITYQELLQLFTYSLTNGGKILFSRMTGIDCHYSNYTVKSLVKDGTVIYRNNRWTGDWASRTLRLVASEYIATSQYVDYYTNLGNPLIEWNSTSRLLYYTLVDNENAVRVLKEEAAASGGLLSIDTAPHFILD